MRKLDKKTKKPKTGTSKTSMQERKRVFAEAYLSNGGNKRKAAIEAGFPEKAADRAGQRYAKDVQVMAIIKQRQDELAEKHNLTTDAIIRSISQEIHFDPAKLYNKDGSLKQIPELDEDTRKALTAVEFEQVGSDKAPVFVRKYKWSARQGAREQAMKHLGMFERDNEQSKPVINGMTDAERAVKLAHILASAKK